MRSFHGGSLFGTRQGDGKVHAPVFTRGAALHSRVILWQAEREAGSGDDT